MLATVKVRPAVEAQRAHPSTLLRSGEVGYGEACCVWNGANDRYPALVGRV